MTRPHGDQARCLPFDGSLGVVVSEAGVQCIKRRFPNGWQNGWPSYARLVDERTAEQGKWSAHSIRWTALAEPGGLACHRVVIIDITAVAIGECRILGVYREE